MRKNYLLYTIFLFLLLSLWEEPGMGLYSQTTAIDSISALLKSDKEDTNKVKHLNDLASELSYQNPDTAILICNQALELATTIVVNKTTGWLKGIAQSNNDIGIYYFLKDNYAKALEYYFNALKLNDELENKTGIASNLGNIGGVYYRQGNYTKALEYYFRGLKLNEEIGNKKGIASNLGNIGNIYFGQGDYPKSLEYYFKALTLNVELGNKKGIAANLGNIGLVYYDRRDYSKALEYYFRGLKLNEELGNKKGIAANLGNIGNIYLDQGANPKALEYYFKALKLNEEFGGKSGMANNLGAIGNIYSDQGDYPKALEYYFKALKLNEVIGNKMGMALNMGYIGDAYNEQKQYKEAEEYLLNALKIFKEIGEFNYLKDCYAALSDLYSKTNRYQLAYEHYKLYTADKDSLFNEEKSKEIGRLEMRHEIEIAEMERERKASEEIKIKTQKTERRNLLEYSGMVIGLIIIGLFVTLLGFVKVKPWVAEGITFFVFLLFFEFILVLLDPYMDKFTKGEPAYKLFINAAVALCIFPLHAFFEKMLKKKLMKKKL